VATDYGQAAHGAQPGTGSRQRRRGRARTGRATAATVLVLGVAGLGVSLAGVVIQLMPRQFTTHQQLQIVDWEAAARWRTIPAGTIFPAVVRYQPPAALGGGTLSLAASRIGIARQASCHAATDAAVAAVLNRNGCQAVLRATYVDKTDSYVVTVGVAAFPGIAQAAAAGLELTSRALTTADGGVLGIRTVEFKNTPAASFSNEQRQISGQQRAATYLVLYTIGYADDRPRVPVAASDSYTYEEMSSLGAGVAEAVQAELAAPLPAPRCPGTPGC
jgi:hypothetical protein